MEVYDINNGYKEITSGNSAEMLNRINNDMQYILSGNYIKSDRKNYCVESHSQPFMQDEYQKAKLQKPFRKEEWMCKICLGKTFPAVGKIVDYQVPIKHSNKEECSGMGKVDLLSCIDDIAYLLELKVPESTESPLRAIMEIYTYWKQLGGNECKCFLEHSKAKGAEQLKKAIVIFEKCEHDSEKFLYKKLVKDEKALRDLMRKLGVECFIATLKENDKSCDEIAGITKW